MFQWDGSAREGWFKAVDKLVSNEFLFYFSGRQAILPKYDLEDIVARLPIPAISVGQKVELIRSLQSGDLQSVDLQLNGKEVRGYIQAAPEEKGVSIFDEQMKSLDIGQLVRKEEKKLRSQRNIGLSMGE